MGGKTNMKRARLNSVLYYARHLREELGYLIECVEEEHRKESGTEGKIEIPYLGRKPVGLKKEETRLINEKEIREIVREEIKKEISRWT